MSAVYQDLNAAGFLVMCYDAPKVNDVLNSFRSGSFNYEFKRQFSDSPRALARYSSTWKAFDDFRTHCSKTRIQPRPYRETLRLLRAGSKGFRPCAE
jgi:hypothetical protein